MTIFKGFQSDATVITMLASGSEHCKDALVADGVMAPLLALLIKGSSKTQGWAPSSNRAKMGISWNYANIDIVIYN